MYSARLRSSFLSSVSNSSFSDCACMLYAVLRWCDLGHSISTCSSVWIPVPQIHNLSCTGVHDQRPVYMTHGLEQQVLKSAGKYYKNKYVGLCWNVPVLGSKL